MTVVPVIHVTVRQHEQYLEPEPDWTQFSFLLKFFFFLLWEDVVRECSDSFHCTRCLPECTFKKKKKTWASSLTTFPFLSSRPSHVSHTKAQPKPITSLMNMLDSAAYFINCSCVFPGQDKSVKRVISEANAACTALEHHAGTLCCTWCHNQVFRSATVTHRIKWFQSTLIQCPKGATQRDLGVRKFDWGGSSALIQTLFSLVQFNHFWLQMENLTCYQEHKIKGIQMQKKNNNKK